MQLDVFSAFRDYALHEGVLFYFNGYLSHNVIGAMGDALRHRLEAQGIKGVVARRVFSTFIEMAQNILNYGVDVASVAGHGRIGKGSVAIGQLGDRFYIICGNRIERTHVERVKEKLDAIRAMSPDEVKQAYKQQLRNEEHEQDPISKGAGLGFLTVARDSSAPIEYCFVEEGGGQDPVSFYLKATI
ncbi:MAG: SiaB family protein kinase [Halothiobacillaceae bacterium]